MSHARMTTLAPLFFLLTSLNFSFIKGLKATSFAVHNSYSLKGILTIYGTDEGEVD